MRISPPLPPSQSSSSNSNFALDYARQYSIDFTYGSGISSYTVPKDSFVYSRELCSANTYVHSFLINNATPVEIHQKSGSYELGTGSHFEYDLYSTFAFARKGDVISKGSCHYLAVIPVRK